MTEEPGIFFANQVIPNACATQAILAVLLNTPEIELGATLTEFKSFSGDFAPDVSQGVRGGAGRAGGDLC